MSARPDPVAALVKIRELVLDPKTGDRPIGNVLAQIEWHCRHGLEDYRVEPVAYTIGFTTSYDEGLITNTGNTKMGQTADYEGGWIWKTAVGAYGWLHSPTGFRLGGEARDPNEFSVYQLDLPHGWEADASKEPGPDGVHLLLHDAIIVARVSV